MGRGKKSYREEARAQVFPGTFSKSNFFCAKSQSPVKHITNSFRVIPGQGRKKVSEIPLGKVCPLTPKQLPETVESHTTLFPGKSLRWDFKRDAKRDN